MSAEGLPESVVEDAERLTRLAREATDPDEAEAYRAERDASLADHGYAARVREDDDGAVLVCYPDEWLADGTVRIDAIEDVDRGIERRLSGPASGEDWGRIDAHNRAVVRAVAERHGEPHASTTRALADFASNHYAKAIEDLTDGECREFRTEYFRRNAWPSDDQVSRVGESVRIARDVAGEMKSTAE